MKLRHLILALFILATPFWAMSTHVVGGSITYEHLGGSTYKVTFKMYRDCDPASIQLPNNVRIEVRQPNGASFAPDKDIVIPKTQVSILNPPIDTCAFDPGICVEEAIYTAVVNNLPPNPGGYHLYYQTCCRNASLVNVNNPLSTGSSYYTYIPDNSVLLTNSSPKWKNFPPVYICQGNQLNFDHGATDKDGDSLNYSFYSPKSYNNPASAPFFPTFPLNIATFLPINYNGGYTFNDPLGGASLTVNPSTGAVTGIPPALGQYVVGIKVDEFRNGVLINTVYRDFQFNVLNCPPIPISAIAPVTGCSGGGIDFINASSPLLGNSFYWDFGDAASITDNSTATNPSYTYPSNGSYTVMLVGQAGTPCADTVYRTINISGVTADFTYTDSTCVNDPVNFFDASVPTTNAVVNSWLWDFGDGSSAITPNPTHTYLISGTLVVKLIVGTDLGCFDSISKDIFVQSLPIALTIDTFACKSSPVINNLNGNVVGAAGGLWIGLGGLSSGFSNTTDLNSSYTPTTADTTAGFVDLILSTTGNGFCPASSDTMRIIYSLGITSEAGNDTSVCKDVISVPLSGSIITASGGEWSSSGVGGSFSPSRFDLNASYLPSTSDTAAGSVRIYLTSTGNGGCLPDVDSLTITFTSTPRVSILSKDTACAGTVFIPINASSSTGSGYWQTLGTGFFSPNDSLMSTTYFADSLDNFIGDVTLVFTSTNNGGCQGYSDTLDLVLIPAPSANFNFVSACPDQTVIFNDISTFVDPIVSWEWDFDNSNIDNVPNTSTIYNTSGTYNVSLIVTSINGCTDTLIQPVLVYSLPVADFSVNGICKGTNSLFVDGSIVTGSTISSWQWDFDDTNTDTVQNPVHSYLNSGTYNVQLIAQSAQGCIDTTVKAVTINPPPTAGFNSAPGSVKINENFVFADISFVNVIDWEWDFGDTLGTSTDQNPTYGYTKAGIYLVCLTVTDALTCKDSICNEVIVYMPPLIPNAFSPNGEGGNDVFYVLGGPYKELEFRVYNNWGELIFESDDQDIGWDGTREGIEQPVGVYVYTVRALTLNDEQHSLKGDVTLLR